MAATLAPPRSASGARRRSRLPPRDRGDEPGDTREGDRPAGSHPHDPTAPDGSLDETLAQGGHRERQADEGQPGEDGQAVSCGLRRQRQQRPVPEVDRVGDAADPAERRGRKDPMDQRRRPRTAGRDDQRGPEDRQERRGPGERRRGVDADDRNAHERHPDDGQEAPRHRRAPKGRRDARGEPERPRDLVHDERDQPTRRQLPGPGRQQVEGQRCVGAGQDDGDDERDDGGQAHDRDDRADRSAAPPPRPEPPHEHEERGPEQVEVLLHGDRPVVQQRRRRRAGLEVVGRLRREPEVGDVQGGRRCVADDVGHPDRRQHDGRRDDDDDDDDECGGKQPSGPARIEGRQGDRPGRRELSRDEAGDQEAGDDEEDIDTDIAAAERRQVRVIGQDHEDRDRAQALDIRAEPAGPLRHPAAPVPAAGATDDRALTRRRAAARAAGNGSGSPGPTASHAMSGSERNHVR